MLTFDKNCKGMVGRKQKCQVISGLNQKICKVFSGRVKHRRVALTAFIALCDSARNVNGYPIMRRVAALLIYPFKQILIIIFDFIFFQKMYIFFSKNMLFMMFRLFLNVIGNRSMIRIAINTNNFAFVLTNNTTNIFLYFFAM